MIFILRYQIVLLYFNSSPVWSYPWHWPKSLFLWFSSPDAAWVSSMEDKDKEIKRAKKIIYLHTHVICMCERKNSLVRHQAKAGFTKDLKICHVWWVFCRAFIILLRKLSLRGKKWDTFQVAAGSWIHALPWVIASKLNSLIQKLSGVEQAFGPAVKTPLEMPTAHATVPGSSSGSVPDLSFLTTLTPRCYR